MKPNIVQQVFMLLAENEKLLERIKELEKELYESKVNLMHAEETSYSK